jgi:dolichyl-phosphate-mannose-protein mannosyltransferase
MRRSHPLSIRRFWRISTPGGVVFDEAHFGKFTAHYMRGSYVFDIHPPLGKMTFAGLGWLLGYDQATCNYQNIGTVYDPVHCQYYLLRGVSATFGSLVCANADHTRPTLVHPR